MDVPRRGFHGARNRRRRIDPAERCRILRPNRSWCRWRRDRISERYLLPLNKAQMKLLSRWRINLAGALCSEVNCAQAAHGADGTAFSTPPRASSWTGLRRCDPGRTLSSSKQGREQTSSASVVTPASPTMPYDLEVLRVATCAPAAIRARRRHYPRHQLLAARKIAASAGEAK